MRSNASVIVRSRLMKRNESKTAVKIVDDAVVITKQVVVVGSQINLKEVGIMAGLKPCSVNDAHRV